MVFSSLLFLYLFLALNLAACWCTRGTARNLVLLGFSLVFYSWGGPRYLLLLVGDAFVSWFLALRIQRSTSPRMRRLLLVLECVALLGVLGIFKYLTFILENVKALTGVPEVIPEIALPIGISFYTFQLLSYVIDVYREQVEAQPVFWKILLYASLFHQCIAGPIVRYATVAEEIEHRTVTLQDVYEGVRRFSIGLAKKAILANACGDAVKELLPAGVEALRAQSTAGLWLGMFFYMLDIYLDFSAYSDMAIGMGRMVGFHYLENFRYPYLARSVQDFWRRWHISLSTFFRDYLYIPLGGNHCSTRRWVLNMTVVWFLTGLWHGASWNFILWGLYYLAFLLLEHFVIRDWLPTPVAHVYTLLVVYFGWVIFRNENMAELGTILMGMFGIGNAGFTGLQATTVFLQNIFLILMCLVAVTPLGNQLRSFLFEASKRCRAVLVVFQITELVIPPVLLILSSLALVGNAYNPFFYLNF